MNPATITTPSQQDMTKKSDYLYDLFANAKSPPVPPPQFVMTDAKTASMLNTYVNAGAKSFERLRSN